MSAGGTGPAERSDGVVVRDVVRQVVAELAPAELPVVDGLAEFDDATVVRRLRRRGRRREPLGFGLDQAVVLLAPVVWLALDEAARQLAVAAVAGVGRSVKALLRKVFRRKAGPVVVPPLTREQLGQVRQRVLEVAARMGMSEDDAGLAAEAVVGRLVLAAGGSGKQDEREPVGSDGFSDSTNDGSPAED